MRQDQVAVLKYPVVQMSSYKQKRNHVSKDFALDMLNTELGNRLSSMCTQKGGRLDRESMSYSTRLLEIVDESHPWWYEASGIKARCIVRGVELSPADGG